MTGSTIATCSQRSSSFERVRVFKYLFPAVELGSIRPIISPVTRREEIRPLMLMIGARCSMLNMFSKVMEEEDWRINVSEKEQNDVVLRRLIEEVPARRTCYRRSGDTRLLFQRVRIQHV